MGEVFFRRNISSLENVNKKINNTLKILKKLKILNRSITVIALWAFLFFETDIWCGDDFLLRPVAVYEREPQTAAYIIDRVIENITEYIRSQSFVVVSSKDIKHIAFLEGYYDTIMALPTVNVIS